MFFVGFLLLPKPEVTLAQDFWRGTNGPNGGSVLALAFNSRNSTIFAGRGDGGGIYRSIDNGADWTQVGFRDTIVLSAAVSPSGDIFAGTYYGLYRSSDNGGSWTEFDTTNGLLGVQSLAFDGSEGIFAGTVARGVHRSSDNGRNWKKVGTMDTVTSLAVNPNVGPVGQIFAGTSNGVFRSTDKGASWVPIDSGLTVLHVKSLVINSKGVIFVGTFGGGVYRSLDNGNNWTPFNSSSFTEFRIFSLAIDSYGDIFAGTYGGGIYRSQVGDADWAPVNTGLTDLHVFSFAIPPTPSTDIFAGTFGGGIYRSADGGFSWTQSNAGLTAEQVFSLSTSSLGDVFAGSYSSGIHRFLQSDGTWKWGSLDAMQVRSLAVNSGNVIFAGSIGSGVFRSADRGNSWTRGDLRLNEAIIYSLAIDTSGTIFAGTFEHGVYRSADNGATFVQSELVGTTVLSLAGNSHGDMFAGTDGRGVYRSTDKGVTWHQAGSLLNKQIASLAVSPHGQIFAGDSLGIYLSTDDGDNWIPVVNGLTNKVVLSLVVNAVGHIYAATDGGGVFRSVDNGSSWQPVITGLTDLHVYSLAVDVTGYLYAGTKSGGVFRNTKTTLLPTIGLVPSQLTFIAGQGQTIPDTQTVKVTNTGGGTLQASIVLPQDAGWLSVSPLTLPPLSGGAGTQIVVQPKTTTLPVGIYSQQISVVDSNALNNPRFITVIYRIVERPIIALSNNQVTFAAQQAQTSLPASQTVTVTNTGGGSLQASISIVPPDNGWLSVSPLTLSPLSGGTGTPITIQPRTTDLTVGDYVQQISVADPNALNNPQIITVTYHILARPAIGLSSPQLTFTAGEGQTSLPASQTVTVTNTGGGSLQASISIVPPDNGWLSVSPLTLSPLSGGTGTPITIQPRTTDLTVGDYVQQISVVDPSALNNPQIITVTYRITARPAIGLSSSQLTFTAGEGQTSLPASQTVTVTNTGGGSLQASIVPQDTIWLSVSPLTLSPLSGGTGTPIIIQPKRTDLTVGDHVQQISVVDPNALNNPKSITVTYHILPRPAIGLSLAQLTFTAGQGQAIPDSQTVTVTNTGGGSLEASVSIDAPDNGWLSVSPLTLSPLSGGTGTPIIIRPKRTDLTVGDHVQQISVVDPNALNNPKSMTVTYHILARPAIGLSLAQLTFTAQQDQPTLPTEQRVTISNTGDGTIHWQRAPLDTTWLGVFPDSGTIVGGGTGSQLSVQPNTTHLTLGTHTTQITIGDTAAGVSATLAVAYNITAKPTVTCGIPSDNFAAKPGERITIPVRVSQDLSGKFASSYDCVLKFRKTMLYPEKLIVANTLSSGATETHNVTMDKLESDSRLAIHVQNPQYFAGSGDLVQIEFVALLGDTCLTPITVESFAFNLSGPLLQTQNGTFTLIGRCSGSYVRTNEQPILQPIFPNPMVTHRGAVIQYGVGVQGHVQLTVYDILGREVERLVDGEQGVGWHEVRFEARNLPSGVYLYRLQSGKFDSIKKLLIVR